MLLDTGAAAGQEAAGRGYVAVGAQGYADDTEAVAPGMGALRRTTPATERWLRLTGQSVNVDKSTSFLEGEDDPAPLLLLGEAIPRSQEFKRLGVKIRAGHRRGAEATLEGGMDSIGEVLLQTPHLPTFERRATVAVVKALPKALHGVALADVETGRLRRLETRVVAAMWGPTRTARAKEVVFCLLTPGHRTSLIMCTRYERLVWLARTAREAGAAQCLFQAVWETQQAPPCTGPVGRALRTARELGWHPLQGWWRWQVPGQDEPLCCSSRRGRS